MLNKRPTQKLKLDGIFGGQADAAIYLRTYITGAESRMIQSVYLDQISISQNGTPGQKMKPEVSGTMKASINHQMQDATIRAIIEKIEVKEIVPQGADSDLQIIENPDEILKFVLNLPTDTYSRVIDEIEAITNPKKA